MIKKLKESPQMGEYIENITSYAVGWSLEDYAMAFMSLEDEYKSKGYTDVSVTRFYVENGKLFAVLNCNGKSKYSVLCDIIDKKGNTKPHYVSVVAGNADDVYDIYDREYFGKWANKNLGYKYGEIISIE